MKKTNEQYLSILINCKKIFINKMNDYGISWKYLRLTALTDQLLIKTNRIKHIELTGKQKIKDDISSEYIGIVNYSIISLIKYFNPILSENKKEIITLYEEYFNNAFELMKAKNTDYDEIWRQMRITSYTDLILTKIYRIKQIEDTGVKHSENVDANYYDILNYAMFGLIRLKYDE